MDGSVRNTCYAPVRGGESAPASADRPCEAGPVLAAERRRLW